MFRLNIFLCVVSAVMIGLLVTVGIARCSEGAHLVSHTSIITTSQIGSDSFSDLPVILSKHTGLVIFLSDLAVWEEPAQRSDWCDHSRRYNGLLAAAITGLVLVIAVPAHWLDL
jgi:hypothetical protein